MKRIILLGLAISVSLALTAQVDSMRKVMNSAIVRDNMKTITNQNTARKIEIENSMTTAVTMKDCKMMTVRVGKMMPMKRSVTMRNGTIVMPSGTILDANGITTTMTEGEYIDMNGKIEYSHELHKFCKKY